MKRVRSLVAMAVGIAGGYLLSTITQPNALAESGGQDTGACCVGGGCEQLTESECDSAGGEWGGVGESCAFCDRACCFPNGECQLRFEKECEAEGGTFFPDAMTCLKVDCSQTCLGDVNDDNAVDVADLLTLLANWGPCE